MPLATERNSVKLGTPQKHLERQPNVKKKSNELTVNGNEINRNQKVERSKIKMMIKEKTKHDRPSGGQDLSRFLNNNNNNNNSNSSSIKKNSVNGLNGTRGG